MRRNEISAEPSGILALVDVPDSCGNAPWKAFVRDFVVALHAKRVDELLGGLTDDALWHVVGSHVLAGTEQVQEWIAEEPDALKLTIHTIITHGRECAVDGTVEYADGKVTAFCHVIVSAGAAKAAKIREIRSYTVKIME